MDSLRLQFFFVGVKKYYFPHSTDCFEKYHFSMIKKVGGLVVLKNVENYMKTVCTMGENGLVKLDVFFGAPLN